MIDTDKYETMTQHDLIEILNHWEQLAFQKTNEVKRLREMVRFLEGDLTHENYYDLHDEGMCDMITRIPCYICEQGEEE